MSCLRLNVGLLEDGVCVCAGILASTLLVCACPAASDLMVCTDEQSDICVCSDVRNSGLCVSTGLVCESDLGARFYLYVEEGRIMIEEGYAQIYENVY